jgi:hypothetical protein
VLAQPGPHVRVGVGAVVVADDVQRPARVGPGDQAQEGQELLVPVPGVAGAGHLAGGGLQRGEQAGGAVPDVVVAALFRDAGPRESDGLRLVPAMCAMWRKELAGKHDYINH